jgi:hypothetical protein
MELATGLCGLVRNGMLFSTKLAAQHLNHSHLNEILQIRQREIRVERGQKSLQVGCIYTTVAIAIKQLE